jgi:hypothetical protein
MYIVYTRKGKCHMPRKSRLFAWWGYTLFRAAEPHIVSSGHLQEIPRSTVSYAFPYCTCFHKLNSSRVDKTWQQVPNISALIERSAYAEEIFSKLSESILSW